jgi:hypothetical protein
MTNYRVLVLERDDDQGNETAFIGRIMLTPAVNEDYWTYRVRLSEGQAILGFPKYYTVGIGFADEEDWNTNLPYTCSTEKIFQHIQHNRGSESITDDDIRAAIKLVQDAARQDRDTEDL